MTKSLEQRLRDAKTELPKIEAALLRHTTRIPTEVATHARKLVALAGDIDPLLHLLQARGAARDLLTDLEGHADADDCVEVGRRPVKFRIARMIGVQAYVVAKWGLADRVTGIAGRFLCTPAVAFDESSPTQLVTHFVKDDGRKKHTAGGIWESIQRTFGWPIGVSYALRNHVVHDGAYAANADLFDGPTAASRFTLSAAGWKKIEQQAKNYGVDVTNHRAGASWPTAPQNDLRDLLDVCEREVDDALGVLLGTAWRLLAAHVGCIVGED